MKENLLIIEDEKSVAKQMKWGLGDTYNVSIAHNTEQARSLLGSGLFRVATLDLGLPPDPDIPTQGFALLQDAASLARGTRVIVITGNAEKENARKAIELGALDFCEKPVDLDMLRVVLERTFHVAKLEKENSELRARQGGADELYGMVGASDAMHRVFEQLKSAANTSYPVLITGHTGTGKELAAMAIHRLSERANLEPVIVNCGAIPENLLESELFGHEKGAFTGAVRSRMGKFEQADGSTIFLDEVGELPLQLQPKLLRVLQESTLERLGGNATKHIDVRVISATNIDLDEAVQNDRFREDLFFRLNVIPIQLPNLKDRSDDIILLANHFLKIESKKLKRGQVRFAPEAISGMLQYSWPGNVRELQNTIRRALGTTLGKTITSSDLGFDESKLYSDAQQFETLKQARDRAEVEAVRKALTLCGYNISKASQLLDISRPTLHDLIKRHQVAIPK